MWFYEQPGSRKDTKRIASYELRGQSYRLQATGILHMAFIIHHSKFKIFFCLLPSAFSAVILRVPELRVAGCGLLKTEYRLLRLATDCWLFV
ncbi:MAG: hypothetical protein A2W90_16705 [Bacteroidetes bacterium GWF2_42_66]|nr:MAG: hypothetical protein A2W92_03910 [Bacteroidetes bacterium GWA2_42_15]OFX96334.1 MAG: hypothetical protein A2W89_05635 [Bacteroidetes bacterium GWE2_42_39]OFY46373.1 MAG: hypothetical protein A2W90_16705 [Bacteroidetes bacterium GWF2_42_66]HBL78240.1 hypothetical protein [Prolixibacteraceae bacterium]HCU60154.1 hypothetical protein [Prolixibacteraceae bacterium]